VRITPAIPLRGALKDLGTDMTMSSFKKSGAAPKKILKSLALASALAATTIAAASPAQARDRYGYGHDRIDAGEVIAGAIILGGIAAILSGDSGGYDSYDRYGGNRDGYNGGERGYDRSRYGGSREAVNRCISAAERRAGYNGGRADVTDITDIYRVRGGYEVRGRIVVQNSYRDDRYGRDQGYGRENYGYDGRYERGSFTCVARYGQVDGLRFHGLR
jgi:hypothetical protein